MPTIDRPSEVLRTADDCSECVAAVAAAANDGRVGGGTVTQSAMPTTRAGMPMDLYRRTHQHERGIIKVK